MEHHNLPRVAMMRKINPVHSMNRSTGSFGSHESAVKVINNIKPTVNIRVDKMRLLLKKSNYMSHYLWLFLLSGAT